MNSQIDKDLEGKLEFMKDRLREVEAILSDPKAVSGPQYPGYVREHGRLRSVVSKYNELSAVTKERLDAEVVMETESDQEMVDLAREEVESLKEKEERLYEALLDAVLAGEEDESRSVIMEIRAGTGGDEACLFAANLFRMYSRYAESRGWKTEVMSGNETDLGGYREVIMAISGEGAFGHLRFESGTHRVQRVPDTEASGRIHTSAATVAVLPEAEDIDVEIRAEDMRVDTYRSSGPGGQHANKTSSAVRITHEPTGIVVSCEDEKSQHKNKAKAMRILRSRLYDDMKRRQDEERGQARRRQIGSGDRSEKIRTYNFPQNRVSDHRINLTLYELDGVMEGNLDKIIEALRDSHRQARVAALAGS